MCPPVSLAVSLSTLRALLDFHAEHASDVALTELADRAIGEWLVRQRGPQGYLWKSVLLPDGSRLRISSLQRTYYATIVGDQLLVEGVSMSPNQFATASLGTVRNAWEAIYVQLPGASAGAAPCQSGFRQRAAANGRQLTDRSATCGEHILRWEVLKSCCIVLKTAEI